MSRICYSSISLKALASYSVLIWIGLATEPMLLKIRGSSTSVLFRFCCFCRISSEPNFLFSWYFLAAINDDFFDRRHLFIVLPAMYCMHGLINYIDTKALQVNLLDDDILLRLLVNDCMYSDTVYSIFLFKWNILTLGLKLFHILYTFSIGIWAKYSSVRLLCLLRHSFIEHNLTDSLCIFKSPVPFSFSKSEYVYGFRSVSKKDKFIEAASNVNSFSLFKEVGTIQGKLWARICKFLRSPRIDSKESIPPAYVAWRAGTSNRVVLPARHAGNRFLGSLKGLQLRPLVSRQRSFSQTMTVYSHNSVYNSLNSMKHNLPILTSMWIRILGFRGSGWRILAN